MKDNQTMETQDLASLRIIMDLLKERDAVFPWEAAFTLKIKTTEATQLLSELVEQAELLSMKAIAITDHDTTAGLKEACKTAKNACKGQGSCKVAANVCKGHNACAGIGHEKLSAAECDAKGGHAV